MRGYLTSLLLFWLALPLAAQEIRARDEITVERILLDVRVTNARGEPMTDLEADDFRVRIDRRDAVVEAAEWIPDDLPVLADEAASDAIVAARKADPPGRLLVFFFQHARQPGANRVSGHMRMIAHAIQFLDTLTSADRVAVLQFDSHLKLRQDFTNDRRKLEKAIKDSILLNRPSPPEAVPRPALAAHLDLDEARRAASPERALFLIGNALNPIAGPKSLVLFGWGLGRFGSMGVSMGRDYMLARRALEASRTAVFSLDVTDADYHSLEVGLEKASADTGGFYAKTHVFPRLAMRKLERTISGHYELVVKRASASRGVHALEVSVIGRRQAIVLAPTSYSDPVE